MGIRKAFSDYNFLIDNEDNFIGVCLGYDFTSEHEWGINGMVSLFGIPALTKKNKGIKSRTITIDIKDQLIYKEVGEYTMLYIGYKGYDDKVNDRLPSDLENYKSNIERLIEKGKDALVTGWCDSAFAVIVKGTKERENLKELRDAFHSKNVAITYLSVAKNVFANSSLALLIKDKIPQNVLDNMKEADQHSLDLSKVRSQHNFLDKLKNTKKFGDYGLHACSPKFIAYGKDKNELKSEQEKYNTKHDVIYWINSSDVYGWFSVEAITKLVKEKNYSVEDFKKEFNNS